MFLVCRIIRALHPAAACGIHRAHPVLSCLPSSERKQIPGRIKMAVGVWLVPLSGRLRSFFKLQIVEVRMIDEDSKFCACTP